MDYSDDGFYTFLCLDSVHCLAVNGTVTSIPVFSQIILNCVPKTNKAFTGLDDMEVSDYWQNDNFEVEYPFNDSKINQKC